MVLNPFATAERAWSAPRFAEPVPPGATDAMAAAQVSPIDPQRGSVLQFIGGNSAGVRVTHDSAMQVAAVWACMDVIASALSSSDWNVYAGLRGADKKEALPDDNLQYLLNTRPNPEMTAQAFKRALGLQAVGISNGYAEIERDMAGRIVALWPLLTCRVEPRRSVEDGRLFYRVNQGGSGDPFVDLEASDVFHIRGAGLTGFVGDDVVGRAVNSIAQAIALDQFGNSYFGNNAQLGTVFFYKGRLNPEQYDRTKADLNKQYAGGANKFKMGLFEGGDWDIKQYGSDAEKSQLLDAKHLSVEEICRWFRVPPHKVAELGHSTNNNIEHQGLEFTRDTLRPWIKEIEQEADYKLVPWRGPKKFIELDVDWAEQGDYKSRAEAYQVLRNIGVFTGNDVARKLGENTFGPDGDLRIVQGAMIKLGDVGAAYAAAKPAATEPPPADVPADDALPPEDAVATAWTRSLFARTKARFDKRMSTGGGRHNAEALARQDCAEYVALEAEHLRTAVYPENEAAPVLLVRDLTNAVIDGLAAEQAATRLMESLKGSR